MRYFIFSDKLVPELRDQAARLRNELPDVLREVEQHPAEIVETRMDAILSLIGLIQRYKCQLSIWSEDGVRQDHLFF